MQVQSRPTADNKPSYGIDDGERSRYATKKRAAEEEAAAALLQQAAQGVVEAASRPSGTGARAAPRLKQHGGKIRTITKAMHGTGMPASGGDRGERSRPATKPGLKQHKWQHSGKIKALTKAIGRGARAEQRTWHAAQAIRMVREASLTFLDADTNHDQRLDFDEFLLAVKRPTGMSDEQKEALREIFDAADESGDGVLSREEFFMWSLTIAAEFNGRCGLESIFERYDSTGDGVLDATEFATAVEDTGFGDVAHELFMQFDADQSGTLSYREIMDVLRDRVSHLSAKCKHVFTRLAFDHAGIIMNHTGRPDRSPVALDVSTWHLEATDVEGLRNEILALISEQEGACVSDFCRHICGDSVEGRASLSERDFVTRMQSVGHTGHAMDLSEAFLCIDLNSSDSIGYSEMYGWLSGQLLPSLATMHTTVRGATLLEDSGRSSLTEVEWSADTLRHEAQWLLLRRGLSPLDLLRGWDRDDDGVMSENEWLYMWKRLVADLRLWDDEVRKVAVDTFRELAKQNQAGDDKTLDVFEFSHWMNTGWTQHRRKLLGETIRKKRVQSALTASGPALLAVETGSGTTKESIMEHTGKVTTHAIGLRGDSIGDAPAPPQRQSSKKSVEPHREAPAIPKPVLTPLEVQEASPREPSPPDLVTTTDGKPEYGLPNPTARPLRRAASASASNLSRARTSYEGPTRADSNIRPPPGQGWKVPQYKPSVPVQAVPWDTMLRLEPSSSPNKSPLAHSPMAARPRTAPRLLVDSQSRTPQFHKTMRPSRSQPLLPTPAYPIPSGVYAGVSYSIPQPHRRDGMRASAPTMASQAFIRTKFVPPPRSGYGHARRPSGVRPRLYGAPSLFGEGLEKELWKAIQRLDCQSAQGASVLQLELLHS